MKFSQKLKRVAGALSLLMVFQVAFSQMIPTKSASAAGEQVTYKLISGDPTKVGGTIEIGVNASGVAGVYGSSVDFKYDPSVIEVTEINKGTAFGSSAVQVPVKEIKNGVASLGVTLTGTSSNGVTLNGTLAVVKAKVLKAGDVKFNFTNSDADLSLSGNTVRVKLSNANSGKINYTSANATQKVGNPIDDLKLVSLTSNVEVGTTNKPITFTAVANKNNVHYEFYTQKNGGKWFKSQTWGTKNTLTWTPGSAGDYKVRVRVKEINSSKSADYKDLSFKVTNGPIQTSKLTSLTSNVVTGKAGQPITFTALANPQTGTYFEFYTQKAGGEWFKSQSWSYKNTLTWTPGKPGTYKVRVRVKHTNSINKSDDYKDLTFVVK